MQVAVRSDVTWILLKYQACSYNLEKCAPVNVLSNNLRFGFWNHPLARRYSFLNGVFFWIKKVIPVSWHYKFDPCLKPNVCSETQNTRILQHPPQCVLVFINLKLPFQDSLSHVTRKARSLLANKVSRQLTRL